MLNLVDASCHILLDLSISFSSNWSFSICFLVVIPSLISYRLGFSEFSLSECSHPLHGLSDHLWAQDFQMSMSSSHLSCNSKLPVGHPGTAHSRDVDIISETSVSLAPSSIPLPPSEGFLLCLLFYFVHFPPSPPPSPGFMPHC